MLDPRGVTSFDDCLALVEATAGSYPICLGWQQCLEHVLPPLAEVVCVEGRSFRRCLAFLVDEELGPHFVFDDGAGLEEVLLSEVAFAEPLSDTARLWIRSFRRWRDGQTHRRRRPLRLIPAP